MVEMICKCCGRKLDLSELRRATIDEECNLICYDCIRTKYTHCEKCGKYFLSNGSSICNKCCGEVYTRLINSYSTKPIPNYINSKKIPTKNDRYFGLELEYNNIPCVMPRTLFNELYIQKKIYNKSDSSISNGVEIVTSPMDKKSIIETIKSMDEGLQSFKLARYKDNAGIHIHVSRNSISPIALHRLSYLFNCRATEYEKRFVYFLSGRLSTSKSDYHDDHYYKLGGNADQKETMSEGTERYKAVNFCNRNTIEFRIFGSSIDTDTICSYIEFTDKAIEYCENFGIKDMNISRFISWLDNNTDNKILKRKIKLFVKNNGELCPNINNFKIDIDNLKNIHVSKYYDIIISSVYASSVKELNDMISIIKANGTPCMYEKHIGRFNKSNMLLKLEKAYKAYCINKIMKGQEEQCA